MRRALRAVGFVVLIGFQIALILIPLWSTLYFVTLALALWVQDLGPSLGYRVHLLCPDCDYVLYSALASAIVALALGVYLIRADIADTWWHLTRRP